MSDEVKGVAILDDRNPDQVLFCVCVDGRHPGAWAFGNFIERIAVRPAGTPHPPGVPSWEYRVAGDVLHLTPSLRVSTSKPHDPCDEKSPMVPVEMFHTALHWSVPFVRWSAIAKDEPADSRWEACRRRNASLLGR